MPFAESRIFREWLSAALEPRDDFNGRWNARNVFRAALFPDFGTDAPDPTVPADETAYDGTGIWTAADEITSPPIAANPGPPGTSYWPPGGLIITGTGSFPIGADPPNSGTGPPFGFTSSAALIVFDGDDTGTGDMLVTLDNVFGDLTYDTTDPGDVRDDTPENPGACFHAYGGVQRVTSGTFTIVWSPDGIMRVGVALP